MIPGLRFASPLSPASSLFRAFERLQIQDPLNSPNGFFKQACLQAVTQSIDEDDHEERGYAASRSLRHAMEEGLRFHDLTLIARRFGYAENFHAVAERRLRLVEKYPEKVKDVLFALEEGEAEETGGVVVSLRAQGFNDEAIARRLDGTVHTGFYRDMRLARAVVQVHDDLSLFRAAWGLASEVDRGERCEALRDVYDSFLRETSETYSGAEWDGIFLRSLRKLVWPDKRRPPTPLFRRLLQIRSLVRMELKGESEFAQLVAARGLPPQTRIAYYDHRRKTIVFERPVSIDLEALSLYGRACVHELRHAADFSESRYAATREGTAVSEGQAALTHELWRFLYVGSEIFDVARLLGQGLLHYLLDDYEGPWLPANR